jgi:type II secretory pathway predicted ATPase ExeA
MDKNQALRNLLDGTASEEEIALLRQALASGEISIGRDVNRSVIIIGSGNTVEYKVELPPEALQRLEPEREPSPLPGSPNPFQPLSGRITDPTRVFDRSQELRRALDFLRAGSSVALIGESGIGKSSLLTALGARVPADLGWEAVALDLQPLQNEDDFYAALCAALGVPDARGYRLQRALQERGRRSLLILDEIEKMTWEGFSRNLRAALRGLAEGSDAPLKLALAARTPLDRLFPDSEGNTSPLAGICLQIDLRPWSAETARAYLDDRLKAGGARFTPEEIERLLQTSGGHPARLTRLAFDLYARKQEPRP